MFEYRLDVYMNILWRLDQERAWVYKKPSWFELPIASFNYIRRYKKISTLEVKLRGYNV